MLSRKSGNKGKKSLTQIDSKILKFVYFYRALFTNQIKRLLNLSPASKYIYERLSFLSKKKNGYLERRFSQPPDTGRIEALYFLNFQAKGVIAEELGIPESAVKWDKRDNSIFFLIHGAEVNEIAISFFIQGKALGYDVEFLSEILAGDMFTFTTTQVTVPDTVQDTTQASTHDTVRAPAQETAQATVQDNDYFLRPDGLLIFNKCRQWSYTYIERERSRENNNVFETKLHIYDLYRQYSFKLRHNNDDFRVLIVGNNNSHIRHLRNLARGISNMDIFWFTTMPALMNNAFGKIWQSLTNDDYLELF